jgi:tRNA threonylcarbamoyladenosine biosynthesis protein TsaE
LCFFGDLGSGKTTFIKGLVEEASGVSSHEVNSPTFSYLNIYSGPRGTVYHFDLYRLRDVDEFLSMGFDEYMDAGGICCIEWSERIAQLLPAQFIKITMIPSAKGGREIEINFYE